MVIGTSLIVKNRDPNALKKKEMKECSIKSVMPTAERKDVLKCVTSLFLQSDVIRGLLPYFPENRQYLILIFSPKLR